MATKRKEVHIYEVNGDGSVKPEGRELEYFTRADDQIKRESDLDRMMRENADYNRNLGAVGESFLPWTYLSKPRREHPGLSNLPKLAQAWGA